MAPSVRFVAYTVIQRQQRLIDQHPDTHRQVLLRKYPQLVSTKLGDGTSVTRTPAAAQRAAAARDASAAQVCSFWGYPFSGSNSSKAAPGRSPDASELASTFHFAGCVVHAVLDPPVLLQAWERAAQQVQKEELGRCRAVLAAGRDSCSEGAHAWFPLPSMVCLACGSRAVTYLVLPRPTLEHLDSAVEHAYASLRVAGEDAVSQHISPVEQHALQRCVCEGVHAMMANLAMVMIPLHCSWAQVYGSQALVKAMS